MDKLNEARRAFLNDFLNREIRRVSTSLGFRNIPVAKFVDIDSKDQTELLRVATRLMELGVVTPQQGLDIFNTGRFPKSEDIGTVQEQFVSERKKGFYNPLVGGVPMIAPPAPKLPAGAKAAGLAQPPSSPSNPSQKNNTPKVPGRPIGKKAPSKTIKGYSRKNIQEIVAKIEDLTKIIQEEIKTKYNVQELNESQSLIVEQLCEAVVCATEVSEWEGQIKMCVNDIENIQKLHAKDEILEISTEHELTIYPSAILYHSNKI
jgi:hypothetical protein